MPSLATVANRYIALTPGPNNAPALPPGATLPASATREVVDLDQLFNTLNPKTRKGLQQVIQGFAEQYAGREPRLRDLGRIHARPRSAATDHFFSELIRDQPVFTSFLVETAKAVTTIGARSEQLTDLIGNANTTFQAVGSEQAALAQGLRELPVALRQGTRTFVQVPSTFAALTQLVEASKPTTKPLETFFPALRSLLRHRHDARRKLQPGVQQARAQQRPHRLGQRAAGARQGADDVLAEHGHRAAGIGPDHRRLRSLHARPRGHAAHVRPGHRLLRRQRPLRAHQPRLPGLQARREQQPHAGGQRPAGARRPASSGQLRRCPGAATQPAADGSSPFTDGELLSCDPTEVP